MKLGPFEISRTVEAIAQPKQVQRELGASGTINSDGYISSSDYNSDLVGRAGLATWQRMRLSDAAVREALQHIIAPIASANWDVEPASDDLLDLEVAAFVRRCFSEWLIEPWPQIVRTALLYLPQGFQVFEVVEQVVEADLTYDLPMGDQQTTPMRQFVVWRRFAHRRPETISKWVTESGELVKIEQTVLDGGRIATPLIPADRLVVLTNEKEGDEWTGTSILRSAYKPWTLKELVEKIAGMAYERHGVGIPVGYMPERLANDNEAFERLEAMLKDMRAGEHHYLAFPGPKGSTTAQGRDGYTVEILTPDGGIPDFIPYLEYLRGEIKGNMLVRFAELGHGSTGARATGDVQSQVWYDALQGVADYVASCFTPAMRRLIDKNYVVERYPRIVARDIEARNLSEYADATGKLVSSGAAIADRSLRGAVRRYMGWPDEDEAEEAGQEEFEPEEEPPTEPEEPEDGDEPEAPELEEGDEEE